MTTERNQGRKLTSEQIERVRKLRTDKTSIRKIAAMMQLSRSTVEKYLKRSE